MLGPLVVRDGDGIDVTPRGTQKRRLLAALVAAVPDPVSAERLADVLWPGRPPSANAIQAQMSRLRRDISPAKIQLRRSGLHARRPRGCDRRQAVRGAPRAGLPPKPTTTPPKRDACCDAAESLVRGRPFDDIADTELGRAESVRLERVARSARRRRLEIELHSDEHVDAACAELEALVVTEPVDEHWWALLMTAQYRQGRQGRRAAHVPDGARRARSRSSGSSRVPSSASSSSGSSPRIRRCGPPTPSRRADAQARPRAGSAASRTA